MLDVFIKNSRYMTTEKNTQFKLVLLELEEIQRLKELLQYLQLQSTIQFEFPWFYFCSLKSAEIVKVFKADPVELI